MPCTLKDPVLQIHACLAVVGAGDEPQRAHQVVKVLVMAMGDVDFAEIAEPTIGQENLATGIRAPRPRCTTLGGSSVTESRFAAPGIDHQVGQLLDLIARRLSVEVQRIVRLLAPGAIDFGQIKIAFECGKLLPVVIAVIAQCDLCRPAAAEHGAHEIHHVVDGGKRQHSTRILIHKLEDLAVGARQSDMSLAKPAVALDNTAGRSNITKIKHQFLAAVVFAGDKLAQGLGPGFGRVADPDRPPPGDRVVSFSVLFSAAERLSGRRYDGEFGDVGCKPVQAPRYGLEADTATLEQKPERIHSVVDGFDLQESAVELRRLAPSGSFRATQPKAASGQQRRPVEH